MADYVPKLGYLITNPSEQRDAVHVAVAPCVAGERLEPGQHVIMTEAQECFIPDSTFRPARSPIGAVDPFLLHSVAKGERFWLFLLPGTITSLRHEWTHPGFATVSQIDADRVVYARAMVEIEAIVEAVSYWPDGDEVEGRTNAEDLIERAKEHLRTGEIQCFGFDGIRDIDWKRFWPNFSIVTGIAVPTPPEYWVRCAC